MEGEVCSRKWEWLLTEAEMWTKTKVYIDYVKAIFRQL